MTALAFYPWPALVIGIACLIAIARYVNGDDS